jgi:hypothetical protein
MGDDELQFVEGVRYTLEHLPAGIDLLKLDCEGAEYHLLSDARFIGHLNPREIRMEYHRGPEPLAARLSEAGYEVAFDPSAGPVGLMTAHRKT